MEQKREFKVRLVDLRRLWAWVINSTPRDGTYRALRHAMKELHPLVKAEEDEKGYHKLPDQFEADEMVQGSFTQFALSGFKEAALQAIRGENHPKREAAPFGAVEFLILPIAEALGFAEQLSYECPMISNARQEP